MDSAPACGGGAVGGGGPLGGPQASGGGLRAGARGLGARGGARLGDKEVQNLRAARALRRASASERGDFFWLYALQGRLLGTLGWAFGHFRAGGPALRLLRRRNLSAGPETFCTGCSR